VNEASKSMRKLSEKILDFAEKTCDDELKRLREECRRKDSIIDGFAANYVPKSLFDAIKEEKDDLLNEVEETNEILKELKEEYEKVFSLLDINSATDNLSERISSLLLENENLKCEYLICGSQLNDLKCGKKKNLKNSTTQTQLIDVDILIREFNNMKFSNELMYQQMCENKRKYQKHVNDLKIENERIQKSLDVAIQEMEQETFKVIEGLMTENEQLKRKLQEK
jgi:hypothetical protein